MYSPEEVAAAKAHILEEVPKGKSLEEICREDMGLTLPSTRLIYQWLHEGSNSYDPEFVQNYARAYIVRQNKIFEEIIEIADTPEVGETTKIGGANGIEIVKADMLGHRKLKIEARQWVLARMNSKRFGNKVETTLQGGDKPIEVDYGKLSPEALEEIAKQSNDGVKD